MSTHNNLNSCADLIHTCWQLEQCDYAVPTYKALIGTFLQREENRPDLLELLGWWFRGLHPGFQCLGMTQQKTSTSSVHLVYTSVYIIWIMRSIPRVFAFTPGIKSCYLELWPHFHRILICKLVRQDWWTCQQTWSTPCKGKQCHGWATFLFKWLFAGENLLTAATTCSFFCHALLS